MSRTGDVLEKMMVVLVVVMVRTVVMIKSAVTAVGIDEAGLGPTPFLSSISERELKSVSREKNEEER